MHEASLMKNLMAKIQALSEEQDAARVVGVHVRLGALSHMSPEHFREHFAESSRGTLAEGAELHITPCTDMTAPHAQDILLEAVEVE